MAAGHMAFKVLGPLMVTVGQEPVKLGGPKQRTVLAMLIAHLGKPLNAETIAEAVYGDEASARSRRTIQTYVSTLRSIVGDVIVRRGSGWVLDVPRDSIDWARFEHLHEAARQLEPEPASAVLREALGLWRGHPYSDIEAHGSLAAEVSRLRELRLSAQEARIDVELELGRHADLIGEIEGMLGENPYRERLRAQHMLALYRAGRQREALRSFQVLRNLLVDELGVDPTPELQDLEQRILEQDESLSPAPRRSIRRRAVLAADVGDPLELVRMPVEEREARLTDAAAVLQSAVEDVPDAQMFVAGTANYLVFKKPGQAAAVAQRFSADLDAAGMRMAIDWGDIEIADDGVSGPPVTRSAVLMAAAHVGQVVLSSDAQEMILSDGAAAGLRVESLGVHELSGIEGELAVYQLLVGDPPRSFPSLRTDRIPPPVPDGRHGSIRGYELREAIGTGSIGTMYRAYQPAIGREVVIEVIGHSESSDAEFIRRFEADAQRLSLLEHPNISTPLDYWRDTDGAYLVYRLHRGGPLTSGAGATPELLTQVGSALAYAHSYGVVHGSIRPDRIMLDESGNGYLIGFPIGGVPPRFSQEYPAYIAPELLAGDRPSAAADIYGLGVLAHEMESGPIDVDRLVEPAHRAVAQALSESPENRQEAISQLMAELAPDRAESGASRFTRTRNPYKGLAAFSESDAADFFGRSEVTRTLVDALAGSPFLAVVGPSGIGKSSVVRAGLIPALRRGALPGSETWLVTDMLPGSHPFLELRRALERVAVDMPTSVLEALATEQSEALQDVSSIMPENAELLLLVDQFEELFTLVDETTRSRFVGLLSTAVKQRHATVMVTMRADFLDRPLAYSELADLFDRRVVTIGSPNQAELRDAVVLPATGVGVEVDSALVERIVTDVHDRPGALPLLQHALSEVFSIRDSDLLSLDAYEEVGGVSGSLAKRAEQTFTGLEPDQQFAAKQVLLRLVTITDESAPTRRRIRVNDLGDLKAEGALDAFVTSRLLVIDSDPDTRAPTVEVAHEALLTNWPRLARWLDGAREDITMARRLDESLRDWEANDRDDAYLLVGGRLSQHQAWTSSSSLTLTEAESTYLQRSAEHDNRLRTQRRRRRNWITGGFAAAAVVASVFGIVALDNAGEAERQAEIASQAADQAKAHELFANAAASIEDDPQLSLLLTLQGVETGEINSLGAATLRKALESEHLIEVADGSWSGVPVSAAISDDGNDIFVITDEGELAAFSRASGHTRLLAEVSDDMSLGRNIGVAADGSIIAAVHVPSGEPPSSEKAPGLMLVDPESGASRRTWTLDGCGAVLMGLSADLSRVALVPSLLTDEVCEHGGEAYVLALPNLSVVWSAAVDGLELFLDDPNYRQLYYGGSGSHVGWFTPEEVAVVQNIETETQTRIPLSNGAWNLGMAFSGDGTKVVIGSRPIRVFDIETGEQLARRPLDAVTSHMFLDDGSVLSTFRDADIEIWDSKTGELITAIKGDGHFPDLSSSPFSAEGLMVLENGARDSVGVFQLDAPDWGAISVDACPESTTARFLTWASLTVRGGRGVISALCDGVPGLSASVLDVESGVFEASVGELLGQYLTLSPEGDRMVGFFGVAERDENDEVLNLAEGMEAVDLVSGVRLHLKQTCVKDGSECVGPTPEPVEVRVPGYITWSPDGSMIAASQPGESWVGVWDANTGQQLWLLEYELASTPNPAGIAFSPDGSQLWVGSHADRINVYETGSWREFMTISEDDGGDLLRFFGDHIFVESVNRQELVVLDSTGTVLSRNPFEPAGGENHVTTSPNGVMTATNGEDGAVRVRDLEAWEILEKIQVADNKVQGTHWLDDQTILVAVADGRLLSISLDLDRLLDLARERITRTFTDTECERFAIQPCPTLEEMRSGRATSE